MNKCRNCLRKEIEFATSNLHYTDFGDVETFDALTERHGLRPVDAELFEQAPTTVNHGWAADDGLMLFTNADPEDPTDPNEHNDQRGYCSYLSIDGPAAAAESLFRDVVDTATYIKGEFSPLTTDDGDQIVSYWDIQDPYPPSTPEQLKAYPGVPDRVAMGHSDTWWSTFFDDLARPKPSYEIVVDLPKRGPTPLSKTSYSDPVDLPDGTAWWYREVEA